jgi:hypothetical protein
VKRFGTIDGLGKVTSQGGAKSGARILREQNDRLVLSFGSKFFSSGRLKIMIASSGLAYDLQRFVCRMILSKKSATFLLGSQFDFGLRPFVEFRLRALDDGS